MYDNDYITRFRNKVNSQADKTAKINDIIAKSLSKTEGFVNGSINAIPIVFINDAKESGEESIIYTYQEAGVSVGNYIYTMGSDHLVYKQIKNIQQDGFINQFRAIACNTEFTLNNKVIVAYFRGSLRATQSEEVNLKNNFGVTSEGEALLMVPSIEVINLNNILTIDNHSWKVSFIDKTTNKGISYIALTEYFPAYIEKTSSNEDEYTPPIEMVPENLLIAGITYTFATEDGYISANKKINIISKTSTSVEFTVPFNTEDIDIQIKAGGIVVSTHYTVRD